MIMSGESRAVKKALFFLKNFVKLMPLGYEMSFGELLVFSLKAVSKKLTRIYNILCMHQEMMMNTMGFKTSSHAAKV